MNQIHTSYEVSKMLKEFLGESAPEPMAKEWWGKSTDGEYHIYSQKARGYNYPAYQLHDLLSKPFCEAFTNACERVNEYCPVESDKDLSMELAYKNYFGGMEAVEKALVEMMEGL